MTNLNLIKSIKGKLFGGIYGRTLHVHKYNDEIIIHCSEPLMSFHSSKGNLDEQFWLFEWEELETGDDVLLINEGRTPEPLDFEIIDSPNQKYIVLASSFYTEKDLIQGVSCYGFFESNQERLTSVVIRLEDSFIHIEASPAIEIRITNEKPVIAEGLSLLVSS
ncbi:hypothetical protein [Oceanobacillus sp. CAU 1775]